MRACCVRNEELWYSSFLSVTGGTDSPELANYLKHISSEAAPMLAALLRGGVSLRVIASKACDWAWYQPLWCSECRQEIPVLLIASPLMLLISRLQIIYASLIEDWEIIQEENCARHKIRVRPVGEEQRAQLDIALNSYIAQEKITLNGISELIEKFESQDAQTRNQFLEAVLIGEMWIISHELSHLMWTVLVENRVNNQTLLTQGEFFNISTSLAHFREQLIATNVDARVVDQWIEEHRADIIACNMLVKSLCETHPDVEKVEALADVRFNAATRVASGFTAALDAIDWVNVVKHDARGVTEHPPIGLRIQAMDSYLKAIANVKDPHLISQFPALIANLSAALRLDWIDRNRQDATTSLNS